MRRLLALVRDLGRLSPDDPGALPAKVNPAVRPMRSHSPVMILINTLQVMRDADRFPSAPDYDYRYMLKDVISACMVATPLALVASFAVGVRAARSLEAEGKFSFLRAASLGALVGGGCLVLLGLLMLPEVFRPLPFAGALLCGATTATVFWAVWRRC